MKKEKTNKKLIITGIIAAISASLCCIAPLLALIAGVSGLASAFTWVEPLRPYLIGLTLLTLGYAWRRQLKTRKEIECDCEADDNPSFFHSKTFLGITTIFVILMLAFPYYNSSLFESDSNISKFTEANLTTANLQFEGMTCKGCESSIANYAKDAGAKSVESNYTTGKAIIKYNKTKTNIDSIVANIELLGYKLKTKKH